MADINVNGTSNGATPVTVVAAPGASTTRMIARYGLSVYNADTAAITLYLQLADGAATRIIEKATINAGSSYFNTSFISLSTTAQSLEIVLSGAVATTEADYVGKYREEGK